MHLHKYLSLSIVKLSPVLRGFDLFAKLGHLLRRLALLCRAKDLEERGGEAFN